MIVDPDFLDHWKTRMLVDALGGDEVAPIYVLRIWAHCQNRRKTQFKPMPNPGLKAMCRYTGDADLLASSLEQSGFIRRFDGDSIEVVGWSEKNAQLLAAWENGAKGGRPKKTQQKPTGNPRKTHSEPSPSSLCREDSVASMNGSTGFDAFWKAVHHKTGKVAAQKAYAKAVLLIRTDEEHEGARDDPHAFLLERMTAFARSPRAKPRDHTPIHPATWLNQGCYDDDPTTWEGNGKTIGDPRGSMDVLAQYIGGLKDDE